jgi:hypothetical protein
MTIYTPSTPITNSSNAPPASLGCFGEAAGGEKVLISAAHVLFSQNQMSVAPQESIYVGSAGRDGSTCCSGESAGVKIGKTIKTWADGFRPIPGKPDVYDTDCAAAILEKGISYSNEIPQIGMIQGFMPLPPADWIMNDLTQLPDPKKMLRMYSLKHGGLRYGTLFYRGDHFPPATSLSEGEFKADDDAERSMRPSGNQLLVMPRLLPNPGETRIQYVQRCKDFFNSGQKLTFSEADDSGSIVVDNVTPNAPKVIGLLSRRFPVDALVAALQSDGTAVSYAMRSVTGMGIVAPIENVLQQLGVAVPPNLKGTVPASGAPAYVVPRILDRADLADMEGTMATFRLRLARTRNGRRVVAMLDEHRAEAQRLVNTTRQVSATWQRHRGPAFIQHFIKNLRDPAHRIPLMIDGVALEELLIRMRTMLARHGSPALVRDLARYGDFTIAALASVSNLHELIDAFGRELLQPA